MRFPAFPIRRSFIGAFALIILTNFLSLGLIYRNMQQVGSTQKKSRYAYEVLSSVDALRTGLLRMESAQRGYLLTLEDDQLVTYNGGEQSVRLSLLALRQQYATDPDALSLVERIETQVARWRDSFLTFSLDQAKLGNQVSAKFLSRGSGYTSAMWQLMDELLAFASKTYDSVDGAFDQANRHAMLILLTGGSISLLVAVLLVLIFGRVIIDPLASLSRAIERVATGNLRLEGSDTPKKTMLRTDELERLQSSEERMRASLREMVTTLHSVSREGNRLGEDLSLRAKDNESVATEAVHSMEGALAVFHGLNQAISVIHETGDVMRTFARNVENNLEAEAVAVEESSAEIMRLIGGIDTLSQVSDRELSLADELHHAAVQGGDDVEEFEAALRSVTDAVSLVSDLALVIDHVSEQTNLLSMNAAIEAAHAGASGKGFSVVADEIRRLAETTGDSAKDIGKTMNAVNSGLALASSASQRAKTVLTQTLDRARALASLSKDTSNRIMQMSEGTGEIREALRDLLVLSDQTKNEGGKVFDTLSVSQQELDRVATLSKEGVESLESGVSILNTLMKATVELEGLVAHNATTMRTLETKIELFEV